MSDDTRPSIHALINDYYEKKPDFSQYLRNSQQPTSSPEDDVNKGVDNLNINKQEYIRGTSYPLPKKSDIEKQKEKTQGDSKDASSSS